MLTDQEKFWAGRPGEEYQDRNRGAAVGSVESNVSFFVPILTDLIVDNSVKSIIEFGAGVGNNLRAIHRIAPQIALSAIEINADACDELPDYVSYECQSALEGHHMGRHDLAFTKGVAIHVAPADLHYLYANLYQTSARYILLCEYYCPTVRMIPYRGVDYVLWARDFAGDMLDRFDDLRLVDYGFTYRLDAFPQDDLTWFLMEKK